MDNRTVFVNLIWRFAERMGAQAVALVVSIVLARILDPTAYGTVALISIFIAIFQVFVDSGLGNALVQKKNADNIDFSTVFYTNVLFCIALYLILFFISPIIARFYKDSSITLYIRVLGITILISGVKNVQQAYISKNMLFKKFFFSTLGGTIVAGAVGVGMAYNGLGIWSLIAQQIINLAIDTVILWCTVQWRPARTFSFERLKTLFSFGWKLLVSSLIDTIYGNIRQLLIGKVYSSLDLAYYNQGEKFPKLVVTNVNTSIDSVLLPALANEQDNKVKVKQMTRRSVKVSLYVITPLMFGLAACAEPIVGLILTEKWLFCVFYMRIFCFTYLLWPLHTTNLNAIKAVGRSDLFLRLEVIKKIIDLVTLVLTLFIGVKAMAISLLFTSVISLIINSSPNKILLDYGVLEQIKDILPTLCLGFLMGMVVYSIQMLNWPYSLTLLVQIPLGAIIYIVGSKLLHIDSFGYLLEIDKTFFKKVKR